MSKYIDELTEDTVPAAADLVVTEQADLSTENKITLANLMKVITSLTALAAIDDGADQFPIYDATASSAKKITMALLAAGVHRLTGRIAQLPAVEATTRCTTGDGQAYLVVPSYLNGLDLIAVHAKVITAGVTGTMDIQVRNVTQAADMLTTKITIDTTELGSDTAATPAVIDTSNDDVASYDTLAIDIDAIHSGTAAKGLFVTLVFG